jgi:N-methylhydantoinase A
LPGGSSGPKPEPLAALEHTVEAIERVASDGSVVTALDEDAVRVQLRRLRDNDIERSPSA